MKLKNDIPVRKIYRHELIYDVAPCKECRLTIFNSCAQSFFNFDSHFFEYRNNSGQKLRCSFEKTPSRRVFSFMNLGCEVLSTKFLRKQSNVLENGKKVLSMMYELIHSDAWFRKKALPYYLSLIKKYGGYSSSWCNLPRIHMGAKITPLRLNYPQQFLLRIRKKDYDCLTQWLQQFTNTTLINFIPGTQFTPIEVLFLRCTRGIRTWVCNVSNFNFHKGGFWIVD
jgi:hypothetical protein